MRRGKGSASLIARLVRACRRFTAYHFWLLGPWVVVAWIAFCFAIKPR